MHELDGVLFGLEWRTSISDDKKELARISEEVKANAYVAVHYGGNHKYGLCDLKKIDKQRSAAAALCGKIEGGNGIFVHLLDETSGLTCLIAIRDHLPVVGLDLVGPREEMLKRLKEYRLERKDDNGLKVYGDYTQALALTLTDLLQAAESATVMRPVTSRNVPLIMAVVTVFAIAGTWFGADLFDMVTPKKPPPPPDPRVEYHRVVVAEIDRIVGLNQFPSNVMAGFIPFAGSLPAEVEGWKLVTVTCVDTDCSVLWRRTPGATAKGFMSALGIAASDTSLSFPSVDQIRREVSFKKGTQQKKLLLGTRNKFGELIISWFQELQDQKQNPTISDNTALIPIPAVAGIPAADKPLVGNYTFTVPYGKLIDVAKLPDVMIIENITMTYKERGSANVEFRGKYYAL
jgi:hypothetical protein